MELLGTLVIQQNVMGWGYSAKEAKPKLIVIARVVAISHEGAKKIVEAHSSALPADLRSYVTYTFSLSERLEPKGGGK